MPSCDPGINERNRQTADNRIPRRKYAPLTVKVESVTSGMVTLTVKDNRGVLHRVENLRWGDETQMWAACPSTLTGEPDPTKVAGRPPSKNDVGTLYLAEDILREDIARTPKFPAELRSEGPTKQVHIVPTSFTLTGSVRGKTRSETVNLLNSNHVSQTKSIEWGDGFLSVHMTKSGHSHVHLSWPEAIDLEAAVELLQRSDNPREIADAWEVVAASMELKEAGAIDLTEWATALAAVQKILPRRGAGGP